MQASVRHSKQNLGYTALSLRGVICYVYSAPTKSRFLGKGFRNANHRSPVREGQFTPTSADDPRRNLARPDLYYYALFALLAYLDTGAG